MAKNRKIDLDDMLGGRVDLFEDKDNPSGNDTSGNDTLDNNPSDNNSEVKSKSVKNSKKKHSDTIDFISDIINKRNDLFLDKSINQVKINNKVKDILDRLKFISGYPISSLADAIILDFYLKNEDDINLRYKNKTKNKLF